MPSDVNIVSFWSSLTQEGTEVTGTVWEVFKLERDTLLCTNVNGYWQYSANRTTAWRNGAPLWSYMRKLPIRSHDMAGVTLRVGVIVVCIRLSDTQETYRWNQLYVNNYLIKSTAVLLQAWSGPEGSRTLRFPDFMTTAQDGGKVVSLTHRPSLPLGNIPGTHFC